MKKIIFFTYALAIVLCVSGCAVSTNPREGGLIGGLYGMNSGAYDARLQQRDNELARQQEANRDLQRQSSALAQQYQVKDRQLAVEHRRVARLDRDLSQMKTQVDGLRTKTRKQKREASNLRQSIVELRSKLQSQQTEISKLDREGGVAANPEQYRVLEKERDRLAEEYRRLVAYSRALSEATR